MLMHSDLVYCADNAMFSMPFVSLGLCAEFASSVLIAMNAGYHKAVEKLLLADPISAEEALEMKIVNRILPPNEVLDYAVRQAERFNKLPPASVRETKRLMKASWTLDGREGHRRRGEVVRRDAAAAGGEGGVRRILRAPGAGLLEVQLRARPPCRCALE